MIIPFKLNNNNLFYYLSYHNLLLYAIEILDENTDFLLEKMFFVISSFLNGLFYPAGLEAQVSEGDLIGLVGQGARITIKIKMRLLGAIFILKVILTSFETVERVHLPAKEAEVSPLLRRQCNSTGGRVILLGYHKHNAHLLKAGIVLI